MMVIHRVQMTEQSYLPPVVQWIVIVGLLMLSSVFAGLTLGYMGLGVRAAHSRSMMSLDPVGLKIVMEAGTEPSRSYAKKIYPLRKHGNLLLCTLLMGLLFVL